MAGMSKERQEEMKVVIAEAEQAEKKLRSLLETLQEDLRGEEDADRYADLESEIETIEQECDNLGGTAVTLQELL